MSLSVECCVLTKRLNVTAQSKYKTNYPQNDINSIQPLQPPESTNCRFIPLPLLAFCSSSDVFYLFLFLVLKEPDAELSDSLSHQFHFRRFLRTLVQYDLNASQFDCSRLCLCLDTASAMMKQFFIQ